MPIGALGFLVCIFYVFIDAISLFYKSQRINYKPQNRMFSVILNCNILVLKVRAGNVKTHLLLIICEFLSNIHFTGMVGDSLTRDHNGMNSPLKTYTMICRLQTMLSTGTVPGGLEYVVIHT
jgi:hypothetical protein